MLLLWLFLVIVLVVFSYCFGGFMLLCWWFLDIGVVVSCYCCGGFLLLFSFSLVFISYCCGGDDKRGWAASGDLLSQTA